MGKTQSNLSELRHNLRAWARTRLWAQVLIGLVLGIGVGAILGPDFGFMSEDSGAIIAAPTTSIPEAPDSGRNWDYRYCWLRDSYFVVHALNALGVTRTMEGYLNYIMNIVATSEDGYLQPVFGIVQDKRLDEAVVDSLVGYRAMGPVRVGNDAYKQVQNDGYGSVVLACAQMFFDQRLYRKGDTALFQRLEKLGAQAARRWNRPERPSS